MKRIILSTIASLLLLAIPSYGQLRIFTIGGSTVQDYNDGYAPRKGSGQMLPFFFDKSKAVCYNKAVEWQKFLELLQRPLASSEKTIKER